MAGSHPALARAAELATSYVETLTERHVGATASAEDLARAFGGPLPEHAESPEDVVAALAGAAGPGLVASAGPRYFGFVTGGSLPAALAADWLTSTWDQNTAVWVMSPAAAAAEDTVRSWVLELLDLPRDAGFGVVTGATMASFTALAVARGAVLRRAGWDVEEDGLAGAPPIRVIAGEAAHASLLLALRLAGLGGRRRVDLVPADAEGRMRPAALEQALGDATGPVIVCAQAGEVNSGACDPLEAITALTREHGAWCHVDGAFGLWARAAPDRAHLVAGAELADSWALDGHKWLNVPYDGAFAVVADPEAHRAAMSAAPAAYLPVSAARSGWEYAPESSRRARAFPAWAAIRSLGRSGVAELVERCCALASRMAERLAAEPGIQVLNDVVLNQVLVAFGDDDATTAEVVARVQEDGTCWAGGSTWHGRAVMRISVSNWMTSEADVDRSAEAIIRLARAARPG